MLQPKNNADARPLRALGAPGLIAVSNAAAVGKCVLLWLVLAAFALPAPAAEPKRVLIVNSFGTTAPPFSFQSTVFKSALMEKMGEPVDLDEVSLDMARYDADMQQPIVEYLKKRQTKWRPDLVVAIGAPAFSFVANYREQLFGETPVLYASADRRLLPPDALEKNAAYVGQTLDIPGLFEDMLQVAPATNNIEIVVGATPLEHLWQEAFEKAAQPLAGRIKFSYYSDLSFDQMLKRVATLPPDSYIFFLILLRDVQGVTINADEALQKLHQVARAPINSIFLHQLGMGIVGGRLLQSERLGKVAADMAVGILHGEPPSNFPPALIERSSPHYDWRELQRWKIDEKLLPPGSTVLYRTPGLWEEYRGLIIGGVSICVVQALLIVALLANLVRRRRAERSLTESEARFRMMADSAPVLIWMAGPDNLGIFFNKAWLDFTGHTMEEELGNGWTDGIHPADQKKAVEICASAVAHREPFAMQFRLRRRDGIYRTVTDEGVPRSDARGNFLGYIGACVDITDLLQKERELRESEESIALAAEAAHLGVWEWDIATNKVWLSDQARELFQFEPEAEITYSLWCDRVHPEDRAKREEAIRRAIDTQSPYEFEYRILLPDQTVRWIAGRGHYLSNPESEGGRLLAVSMDVTERKQTEQLFQLAAEVSHLGVWDWDETAGKLSWDGAMREIFDVPREGEVTLDTFYGALYPPDLERVKQVWREAVESGQPYQLEYRVRRSNGAIGWVHARGRGYYDDKGKPLRMIGLAFDITERKQAEEEARHRREQINLLSRVSLLGEMTASIAHEVNQPLSSIMSNAGAGQRFIDRGDIDLALLREILLDVEADAHRAHEIIRNIRDTMKKGATVRRPIDANAIVTQVAHMLQPDIAAHGVELTTSLAKDLPMVPADPVQIQQVLVNLLSNALDAMHETPLGQREMHVATAKNGNETIWISVRDRGGGIAPEINGQLFNQFFTTKEKGLGMGLSIVRSIVEAHGGTIEAENDGDGACFSFTLPID